VFGYTQTAILKRSKYLPHLTSCDCRISETKLSSCLQLQITANKMQLFLNLFVFTDALHVSGDLSAHHQERITVHTASGISGSWFCASAMTTMNKNQPDAQQS
jgi:hypothetical protein